MRNSTYGQNGPWGEKLRWGRHRIAMPSEKTKPQKHEPPNPYLRKVHERMRHPRPGARAD